jgi:hypothetical protein
MTDFSKRLLELALVHERWWPTPTKKEGSGVSSCAAPIPVAGRKLPHKPANPLEAWIAAHQAEASRYPPAYRAPLMGDKRRAQLAKIDAQVAALSSAV